MGVLRNSIITFDEFCLEVQKKIFAYHKINPQTLLYSYDDMLDKISMAENKAKDFLVNVMGVSEKNLIQIEKEVLAMSDDHKEDIYEGVSLHIDEYFENHTLNKNGFCLKSKVLGKAVQMRNNKDMLGVIRELVEGSSRFIMVDFGEKDGAVKIDIDELIY